MLNTNLVLKILANNFETAHLAQRLVISLVIIPRENDSLRLYNPVSRI